MSMPAPQAQHRRFGPASPLELSSAGGGAGVGPLACRCEGAVPAAGSSALVATALILLPQAPRIAGGSLAAVSGSRPTDGGSVRLLRDLRHDKQRGHRGWG